MTEVKPDGEGSTVYTSWFGDKSADSWHLIARFRRPQTDTYLRDFNSFLESFMPSRGHILRKVQFHNVWVRDIRGSWHECTEATFSVDGTGAGRHRLDFNGGSKDNHFFLKNCGFFNETGTPGDWYKREPSAEQEPKIDFDKLHALAQPLREEK